MGVTGDLIDSDVSVDDVGDVGDGGVPILRFCALEATSRRSKMEGVDLGATRELEGNGGAASPFLGVRDRCLPPFCLSLFLDPFPDRMELEPAPPFDTSDALDTRLLDSPLTTDADVEPTSMVVADTASSDSGTRNLFCNRSCWIISGRYGT